MIVCLVDAGNTRIKWALWDTGAPVGQWIAAGGVPTAEPAALRPAIEAAGEAGVTQALFCSVASESTSERVEAMLDACRVGATARFRALPRVGPLSNAYERPSQLGADRLAAALGAWNRVHADVVVVGAGTATTIDIVRATGAGEARFDGGVILPGLDLMIAALAKNTAGLPMAIGAYRPVPANTDDAIFTGCVNAQAGAVDRMRGLVPAGAACVVTGGAAPRLLPQLGSGVLHVPGLVLEGLAVAILQGF